jgi:tRNA1Val (adenine37-N6)-methyltransferase
MAEHLFRLGEFVLRQERSAMRVTTDGVLLGAWTACEGAREILDVGAGTGLIALMLAQRCGGKVTALEPDEASYEDLRYNIEHAPWAGRMRAVRKSLQAFAAGDNEKGRYDLIVSNPPFFSGDKLPGDAGRRVARHALTLTHEELLAGVSRLLASDGCFYLILPARYEAKIIALAAERSLFCNRVLRVRPREGKPDNRVLLAFGTKKLPLRSGLLVLHEGKGYSNAYRELTKVYYPSS